MYFFVKHVLIKFHMRLSGVILPALNIALKEEFQRLKIATGEVGNNGQLRSREEHPLVSGKPFYRTQPVTESTNLATQQLQQIRSALRKQQHVNHPNNSLA